LKIESSSKSCDDYRAIASARRDCLFAPVALARRLKF